MKNFIGQIHDTRHLSQGQIDVVKAKIKNMLQLDTIEITDNGGEFYNVSTNDTNIVDFKIDNYNNDKVSLVKYSYYNDEMKRDDSGATLTYSKIKAAE